MNEPESEGAPVDIVELWTQLVDFEDGSMDEEEREKLMTLLSESRAARRLYVEYFRHSVGLEAEARFLNEQGKLPVLEDSLRSRRIFRRSVLAAAAVLIFGAIVAALVMVKPPESRHLTAAATADTKWAVDGVVQDPDAGEWIVTAGSTVQVWSGMVKLDLESGGTMVMQGPARVSFPELEKPVLSSGWLWIDSEGSGEAFEVDTPEWLARDIGTRFGVRVPEQGPAEVHLIEGVVEVIEKSTQKKIVTLDLKEQGFAIPAKGKPVALALARDPFPQIADLLAAPGNYPTTVRSQNPAAYWRMKEEASGALANEIPESSVGHRHPKVVLGEPGPGSTNGFHGFGRGNSSVLLPAEPNGAPLSLGGTLVHDGNLFRDEFDVAHDYTGGVTGSIWHGVVNPESVVSLDADTTVAGRLRISAKEDKGWEDGRNNAPFLYRNVSGNFDVRVEVSAQTFGNHSSGCLMARLGTPSANGDPGEDYMSVNSDCFNTGTNGIRLRFLRNGVRNDSRTNSTSVFPRHLRLTRTGNTFHAFESTDGHRWTPISWGGTTGPEIGAGLVRDDLDGLPLQVGLWQASFSSEIQTADFDNFSIRTAPALDSGPSGTPVRVARKEGAVSFWMRREPGGERKETLWAAGENMSDGAISAHLTDDGRAGFFMENGRYDVSLASKRPIDDGKWHHVVASWSPSAVHLYLDGKLVASDTAYRAMQQGVLPELRFGIGDEASGAAAFNGWVDEIALWDRALTPAEVSHQFSSAKKQ